MNFKQRRQTPPPAEKTLWIANEIQCGDAINAMFTVPTKPPKLRDPNDQALVNAFYDQFQDLNNLPWYCSLSSLLDALLQLLHSNALHLTYACLFFSAWLLKPDKPKVTNLLPNDQFSQLPDTLASNQSECDILCLICMNNKKQVAY